MKYITILGSTGSIGTQTLSIIKDNPDRLACVALTAGENIELLEKQIRTFMPKVVCVSRKEKAQELQNNIKDLSVKVLYGMDGFIECATIPESNIVVAAMVGMIGLKPVLAAIDEGKDIALANKETLVCAGEIIKKHAKDHNVNLYPVDSEHSAIFQSLNGENKTQMDCLYLTASGGPFRQKTKDELAHVTVEDALKHPNWSMGHKITIDSATMVNKGLEVIEAHHLFDADFDQIKVVVQPQSLIHSMVQYVDGAVIAQLGTPDMRIPIQYALFYPDRIPLTGERIDFFAMRQITFEQPNRETFPCLDYAYEVGKQGGNMPTVFNAANEFAVAQFLQKKISFLRIYETIEYAISHMPFYQCETIEDILNVEKETYQLLERKN